MFDRLAVFLFLVAGFLINAPAQAEEKDGSFSFIVIGDGPYGDSDKKVFDRAINLIDADSSIPFVVHLGDFISGDDKCDNGKYETYFSWITKKIFKPVFYTPGDNEWIDCDREWQGGYSESERLDYLRQILVSRPIEGADRFRAIRQATLPENLTWSHLNVQFGTIHVVGSNNGWQQGLNPVDQIQRKKTIERRNTANLIWLEELFLHAKRNSAKAVVVSMQADPAPWNMKKSRGVLCKTPTPKNEILCDGFLELRQKLTSLATRKDYEHLQILLIHGDTWDFTLDQTFFGPKDKLPKNLWRLNAAGDYDESKMKGICDVTKVTIDLTSKKPFSAVGFLTNSLPGTGRGSDPKVDEKCP